MKTTLSLGEIMDTVQKSQPRRLFIMHEPKSPAPRFSISHHEGTGAWQLTPVPEFYISYEDSQGKWHALLPQENLCVESVAQAFDKAGLSFDFGAGIS